MTANVTVAYTIGAGAPGPQNTLTLSLPSSQPAVTNYPLQFARPFLQGAIPSGFAPTVTIGGMAIPTQADIKQRWADGSVKHAVIACIVPSIPAGGNVTLGFALGPTNNAPLTATQMLDASYDFEAELSVAGPAMVIGATLSTVNNTLATWTPITNGAFAVTINGTAYQVGPIDFSGAKYMWTRYPPASYPTVASAIQTALVTAGVPATLSYYGTGPGTNPNAFRFALTSTDFSGAATIAAAGSPASGTDISAMLGLGAGATVSAAVSTLASARAMLSNGDYTLWTSGPVAQTIALSDDATGKYDIGFGDGNHPLRPRFYATFWPALNAVNVRVVAENDHMSQLEDLAYKATVRLGDTAPATAYSANLSGTQATNPKLHWALTNWTKSFWHGASPPAAVNIDNNLAYLVSTRFLPNYDPAITVSPNEIAGLYSTWTARANDIYDALWDQQGIWQSGMGTTGARAEIAPYPQWHVLWLYSGDYRLRQIALGQTDLAGCFPGNLREDVAGKRLSRADATGSSTGLGHAISITDRPTFLSSTLVYGYTHAADAVVYVGNVSAGIMWSFDGAHQPSPYYPAYLVTGDPWYLQEMYLWAGFSAALYNGASPGSSQGRGPTGSYGGINDQLRGAGWVLRNRAETAFIAPDADPEKAYFTYLVNDALARWEGVFGLTGTPFDGTPIKNWGITTGNYYSLNEGPLAGKVPPLGNWESGGVPNGKDATIVNNQNESVFAPGVVGSYTAPWTHWYLQYALGRAAELGFAAGPLRAYTGQYPIGMILDSGYPHIISIYEIPVEFNATNPSPPPTLSIPPGGYMDTWPKVLSGLTTAFLTGVNWPSTGNNGAGDLDTYFAHDLTDDGREIWLLPGMAMMQDAGDPRAAAAWAWFLPNVYQATPGSLLANDPKWCITPRADNNILPAMPTAIP